MNTEKFIMIGVERKIHKYLLEQKEKTGVPIYKQIELMIQKEKEEKKTK